MKHKYLLWQALIFILILSVSLPAMSAENSTNRIYGSDRYQTAVEASNFGWGNNDYVILTGKDAPMDAICAASLSGQFNASVLFTPSSSLPLPVLEEIKTLVAGNVIIVGGEAVVSPGIEKHLKDQAFNVTRIGGINRYETAAKIAFEIKSRRSSGIPERTAILTNRESIPDALTASVLAAEKKYPVMYTQREVFTEETAGTLEKLGIKKLIVIGGEAAVPAAIIPEKYEVIRIQGADRYETSLRMVDYTTSTLGFGLNTVIVASGNAYADGLVAGSLAARMNAPLMLVKTNVPPPASLTSWYRTAFDTVNELYLIGGQGVISEDTETWLRTGVVPPPSQPQAGGPKSIRISVAKQRFYLYEGATLIKEYPCSTGTWLHPTPKGKFRINGKARNAWSKKYSCWMPYCMTFIGSEYAIHELPVTRSGRRIGVYSLGRRASHGCVRLGIGSAAYVYGWATVGTPVEVY